MSDWDDRVEVLRFADGGETPNHPRFPVVFYRSVFPGSGDRSDEIERCFLANGWRGTWRWGVYRFHHYHSTAHEVLGCGRGEALIRLGGAKGRDVRVKAGDAVLLPAGTGHCCVESSTVFQVVGAYPPGQLVDLIRSDEGDIARTRERILAVAVPACDPVFGKNGPLDRFWK